MDPVGVIDLFTCKDAICIELAKCCNLVFVMGLCYKHIAPAVIFHVPVTVIHCNIAYGTPTSAPKLKLSTKDVPRHLAQMLHGTNVSTSGWFREKVARECWS